MKLQRSDDDMNFWADHDEDCHGIKKDLADEPEYAGGFIWSCCDQRGNAVGCEAREHDVWIKRTRLVQSPSWLGRSFETQKTSEDRGSAL